MYARRAVHWLGWSPIALALALVATGSGAAQVDVAQELERLMAAHGFRMKQADLDATRDKQARAQGTELLPRLRLLLEGFDHIIVQSPQGGVERVLILGEKVAYTPPPPPAAAPTRPAGPGPAAGEIVLETQRIGASHAVTATLEGEGGKRVQRVLLVDTGADYLVLPSSLIGQLGILPEGLRQQQVQTANGPADAALGTLPAVWLKDQRIVGVEVAFIDDARLGGNALLGMSLLGRFRVTIDDTQGRLVLDGK
jgi:clan AA aspartic protease (TIGR02281 family)